MGRLFVFQVVVQPKHKLITDGPYAWVRHPSYTGAALGILGMAAVIRVPGTWGRECATSSKGGLLLLGLLSIGSVVWFQGMVVKCATEDKVLRKTFGREWDEYAKAVPYQIIPGVL